MLKQEPTGGDWTNMLLFQVVKGVLDLSRFCVLLQRRFPVSMPTPHGPPTTTCLQSTLFEVQSRCSFGSQSRWKMSSRLPWASRPRLVQLLLVPWREWHGSWVDSKTWETTHGLFIYFSGPTKTILAYATFARSPTFKGHMAFVEGMGTGTTLFSGQEIIQSETSSGGKWT